VRHEGQRVVWERSALRWKHLSWQCRSQEQPRVPALSGAKSRCPPEKGKEMLQKAAGQRALLPLGGVGKPAYVRHASNIPTHRPEARLDPALPKPQPWGCSTPGTPMGSYTGACGHWYPVFKGGGVLPNQRC